MAIKGETDQDVEGRLKHELKIYEVLRGLAEVPTLKNFVTDRNAKEFMILELLGTSLETLFNYCERQLTVKDLVALAIKLLELSQQIHERNVIHGCLVPEHILVGDGWKGNDFVGNTQGAKLHAISLSRARIYTNDDNDRLLPAARSAELCYANPFAGLCAHRDKRTHSCPILFPRCCSRLYRTISSRRPGVHFFDPSVSFPRQAPVGS